MDVKAYRYTALRIKVRDPVKLPSMALDTGIHAGMTMLAEFPCNQALLKDLSSNYRVFKLIQRLYHIPKFSSPDAGESSEY